MRRPTRLLILGPDNEPLWVRLYVYPVGDRWAAVIVADTVGASGPGRGESVAVLRRHGGGGEGGRAPVSRAVHGAELAMVL